MSFRFSFKADSDDESPASNEETNNAGDLGLTAANPETVEVEARELVPEDDPSPHPILIQPFSIPNSTTTLLKRDPSDAVFQIASTEDPANPSLISKVVLEGTDLVKGVYEGGLKTWEGASDLCQILASEAWRDKVKGMKVLELGCGSALPGILCLGLGAKEVHLQDYNDAVLRLITVPNVAVNSNNGNLEPQEEPVDLVMSLDNATAAGKVRYFSGPWSGLSPLLELQTYNLILTSETIYDSSYRPSLLDLMEHALAPTGQILLAAKRNYFGLSGGLFGFLEEVERRDKWTCEKVWEGGEVGREVWGFRWM